MSTNLQAVPGKAAFLSHSSSDSSLAIQLCDLLEAQGITCWIAPRDVVLGKPYAEECVRGIEVSAAFVLLASAAAISSVQVLAEVEQAHKRRKPIYTILIGKPQVTKEMDYYISRLHWIEFTGHTPEDIAGRLAKVISGKSDWPEVSSPPSLLRTVLYRRNAFVTSALGTLLVLVLAGAGLWYWAHNALRKLDVDFRSLGQITFSAPAQMAANKLDLSAEVWVLAEGVRFGDVQFLTTVQHANGTIEKADLTASLRPEQMGQLEVIPIELPADTKKLTTCVVVPSPRRQERYRVTQEFSLFPEKEGSMSVSRISEPRVTLDDKSPCEAMQ